MASMFDSRAKFLGLSPNVVHCRQFDVLTTNTCPRSEASRANMLEHQISMGQLSDQ